MDWTTICGSFSEPMRKGWTRCAGKCAGLRQAGPGDVRNFARGNLEITQEDLEACKPDWLITYGYEREAPKGWEDRASGELARHGCPAQGAGVCL